MQSRSIGAAIALVFLLLALAENADSAEMVAQFGNDQVVVTDKACTNKRVLMLMTEREIPTDEAKEARATVDGKTHRACWFLLQGRAVGLVFEDGDQGAVPLQFFTRSI